MNKETRRLLLGQASRLAALGLTVERERSRLKKLVERGVPYSSPEMLAALRRFAQADAEWKRLEVEHLTLRERLEQVHREGLF